MIYRVYAESRCHAEAICLIDGDYYDNGLSVLLERYFKKHRMIVTEGMEENITMDTVFKQIQSGEDVA